MFNQKWKIGDVEIPNRTCLAPMEAVNCASFRVMCKQHGCGLIFTDMIDTKQFLSILKDNKDDEELTVKQVINPQLKGKNIETPLVIQLGSGNKDELAHTTQIVSKYADIIDINLGCPLPDMLGRKGGCYLMKHPNILEKIIPSLTDNTNKPVTAKIRTGWDLPGNYLEVAKLLERYDFKAITLHPRTRIEKYKVKARWDEIAKLKKHVSIPVIGNGDISTRNNALTMLGQTKCDAVMIGRAAKGNPYIFNDVINNEHTAWYEKQKSFLRFLELYETIEERFRLSEVQDHAAWWVSGRNDSRSLKEKIRTTKSLDELKRLWDNI